ncbi:hypothetical protein Pint_30114 [Pistacia integerrima]|uniref:Uncharacterized protein n=1 Tax=Pistacia integerrima TaxID=434235 RepID=A0ACC0WZ28_9ROSI|nr:hypothetical protein Pint_30114 [Pistacia integerrima]
MVKNPSRNFPLGPKAAFTVAFIFLLTFLSLKSGEDESFFEMKIGSSPPTCANKCFDCRPCTATLVRINDGQIRSREAPNHDLQDYNSYYAQVWKCKCGNNIYDP